MDPKLVTLDLFPLLPGLEEKDEARVGEKSCVSNLVTWDFPPLPRIEGKDEVSEESSTPKLVTLDLFPIPRVEEKDLQLSLSRGDYKGKQENKSLSLGDISLELSLSTGYTFTSKEKRERAEVGESSDHVRQEPEVGVLSSEQSLGTYCTSKKRERTENASSTARRVWSCRNNRARVVRVEREEALGRADPWRIRKRLTESDVGNNSRLMLSLESLRSHVYPFWNEHQLASIKQGLPVSVWDNDTETQHELEFKQWNQRANVFKKNWIPEFVKRRQLKQGDEIGLYWDTINSRFQFAVLNRAAPQ